ncbi:MAG: hypothetical protein ACYDHU_02930 [Acidimicrobiales bacterium]
MWGSLLEVMALLWVLGAVPAGAAIGCRPAAVFAAPLAGAVVGAFAAAGEFAVGGSLVPWVVALGASSSAVAAVAIWSRHRSRPLRAELSAGLSAWSTSSVAWSALTVVVVSLAAGWSLQALRAPIIGYDANAIWLIHALAVYGGHHTFVGVLQSPAYNFTSPDYPPLVPAASALGFAVVGHPDLRLGVGITSALSACALAVVACGIASIGSVGGVSAARRTQVVGLLAGSAVCLGGFEFATPYGVSGYADLLWAAAATAAVVYGLVLPRSHWHLALAWLCATASALTKNEGMVTALVLAALVSVRYVSRGAPGAADAGSVARRSQQPVLPVSIENAWPRWRLRMVVAFFLALPSVLWPLLMLVNGIGSNFFTGARHAHSLLWRVWPTVTGMADHLVVLPVAAAVTAVGLVAVGRTRRRAGLASPGWLWSTALGYSLALMGTYVVGSKSIKWWLTTSVARTTIFLQLVLAAEIAAWAVVSVGGAVRRTGTKAVGDRVPR